jgi:hypothetical protein
LVTSGLLVPIAHCSCRADAVGHRRQRLALRDLRRGQQVRLHRRVGQVDGQDLLVVPPGRVEELVVLQRDAGTDRLRLVDQVQPIRRVREGRRGRGDRGRGNDRTHQRARTRFEHPGSYLRERYCGEPAI